VEEGDHRARGLVDDLLDQAESVLGALAEADERDVGPLPRGHRADVGDRDLGSDHLVAESGDDRHDEGERVASLVGDENA
jgi:hypothetical protein